MMEGEKFGKTQRSKRVPVWKDRGSYSVKLETQRRDFENYFAEILFIFSCMKI